MKGKNSEHTLGYVIMFTDKRYIVIDETEDKALLTHISDPLNKNDNARWFLKSFLPSPVGKISKENIKRLKER
ncbi:hypothetical protein 015DV002_14 [Bacillus phage 015DV002]|nr:hypothetical protein 000TH008_16 [Bacillus phage 000TH008]QQO40710.1 hypothetical protein 000TH009_16 [Bacillus phage 000TH009]QQO40972.1 hypothetical protein 015DV002_14 [Bacillus phage 015DV002]QQO41233.1 hypothetical protein 015DV004_17 [Bacillus phage 015DV004]